MQKRWFVAFVTILLMTTGATYAEVYRVTVTRVEKDLYRVDDERPRIYIETKYCYEYATRDDAVLRWEGKYGNNHLVFSTGTSCDVVSIR